MCVLVVRITGPLAVASRATLVDLLRYAVSFDIVLVLVEAETERGGICLSVWGSHATTMARLPLSNHQDITNSLLVYPLKLCATTTLTSYLPPFGLRRAQPEIPPAPYVPDKASYFVRHFIRHALLMTLPHCSHLGPSEGSVDERTIL